MKRLTYFLAVLTGFVFYSVVCNAQNGVITTYAGSGVGGYTGDGGTALSANIYPAGVAVDASGNVFFTDAANNVIRKINAEGTISTIAGTGATGYTGDGGPATAATLYDPFGIAIDRYGNIYIADEYNNVIRKIDTSGIITTVAGNGIWGYSGDGGAATAAELDYPIFLAVDNNGNICISSGDWPIVRKVNSLGIITTITGSYTAGYSGDGGPATAALIGYSINGVASDGVGNFYLSDANNKRIRKIDTAGIITTIAGTGVAGYSGDGGMAVLAEISTGGGLVFDLAGNLFISDAGNSRIREINIAGVITTIGGNGISGYSGDGGPAILANIAPFQCAFDAAHNLYFGDSYKIRKIAMTANVIADSFSVFINNLCGGVELSTITTDPSASSLQTWFGDGTQETDVLTGTGSIGSEYANVVHSYAAPGTYTIREILMNGTTVIDSAHYSYQYLLCQTFYVAFYYDANNNCIKDSGEFFFNLPFTIEVDSNGVAVDTISATSGLYYNAFGNAGDIYSFKVISAPGGLTTTCMPGGFVSDTLDSISYNVKANYIGFSCSSATGFDLAVNASIITGRHTAQGDILVYNNYCTPENAVVTMDFSPQYVFGSSTPAPVSVVGNTATWDLSNVAASSLPQNIQFILNVPTPEITSTWLTPGDTLHFNFNVAPTTGDVNPVNNYCIVVNTVTGSWDPNEMAVTPSGYIYSGTQLQYTIQFENTGNDTAFNISVYDTLSDYVDVQSLRMVAASAVMNTAMLKYNGHNIVKFDFPNINLLDSAYHNQCNGMLTFNINTLSGLPNGTSIFNHAGIFFDDNAVVMTDTVEDIIGIPTGIAAVNNASKVIIYPNPANDQLTISIDNATYSSASITNVFGQQLLSQAINSAQTLVNVKALPAGMYYITLRGDSGVQVLKFEKL